MQFISKEGEKKALESITARIFLPFLLKVVAKQGQLYGLVAVTSRVLLVLLQQFTLCLTVSLWLQQIM